MKIDARTAGKRYWADHLRDHEYTGDAREAFWEWVNEELTQARADKLPDFDFHTLWAEFCESFSDAREQTQQQDSVSL